jgi:hypothetical protein
MKVAEELAAGTVTEAGTVRDGLLSESETVTPPEGAAEVRVTVHVLAAPEAKVVGLQASEERLTGTTRLMEAVLETPPRVAVRVALWVLGMVPAVAVKVAEVDAAGTMTEATTGSRLLLLERETVAAPVSAALVRVTVQVAEELGPRAGGIAGQRGDRDRRHQADTRIGRATVVGGGERDALIAADSRSRSVKSSRSRRCRHRDRCRDGEGRIRAG